jgi:hypothetical protein
MGNTLKVVGWFFGILFILFGLLLVPGNAIAALIVMFIGVLMCYGGSRSGKTATSYASGGPSNTRRIEEEKRNNERRTRARQFWYWNTYINPNGPMNRRR